MIELNTKKFKDFSLNDEIIETESIKEEIDKIESKLNGIQIKNSSKLISLMGTIKDIIQEFGGNTIYSENDSTAGFKDANIKVWTKYLQYLKHGNSIAVLYDSDIIPIQYSYANTYKFSLFHSTEITVDDIETIGFVGFGDSLLAIPYINSPKPISLDFIPDSILANDGFVIIKDINGNTYKKSSSGIINRSFLEELCQIEEIESVKLAANTTIIRHGAFEGAKNLSYVFSPINNICKTIEKNAFKDCINLKMIAFGDGCLIDDGSFENCINLQSVYIPSKNISISDNAFNIPEENACKIKVVVGTDLNVKDLYTIIEKIALKGKTKELIDYYKNQWIFKEDCESSLIGLNNMKNSVNFSPDYNQFVCDECCTNDYNMCKSHKAYFSSNYSESKDIILGDMILDIKDDKTYNLVYIYMTRNNYLEDKYINLVCNDCGTTMKGNILLKDESYSIGYENICSYTEKQILSDNFAKELNDKMEKVKNVIKYQGLEEKTSKILNNIFKTCVPNKFYKKIKFNYKTNVS